MITREEYLKAVEIIKAYQSQVTDHFKEIKKHRSELEFTGIDESTDIYYDLPASVRMINILKAMGVEKVGDIQNFTKNDFYSRRGMGKTGFVELEKIMYAAGVDYKKINL